uniref:Mitotic arrest deficient 1 like 1 n=1 Tax=Cynoglossus semilaevis TaxID=244447 RepID=A0A3P8UR86_CYNSE
MDSEDDTTVLTTLKSFNSFISDSEKNLTEPPGCSFRHQFKRSMDVLDATERAQSKKRCLQLDHEKKRMEVSHKRARYELEKAASDRARELEHEMGRSQDLLGKIIRLEEREADAVKNLSEQMETNRALRKNVIGLTKKLEERDLSLNTVNQTVSTLKDEIRELKQKIQNKDSTISAQSLENQEMQERLDLQHRKYQEVYQLCQTLQAAESICSEHVVKIKELERRLALQEQDMAVVTTVKLEVEKVPELENEVKRLQEENNFLSDITENFRLMEEEVEGLRRKLERMEKTKEDLVKMELQKERLAEKLQAWENLQQSTGLNIRKPDDLSREVVQIQQREIALKEQNYTLNSRVRNVERMQTELHAELSYQCSRTVEEQKKRETQEALVRRLQKRILLLTKERDGMRAILESYDSELAATDYSPQLTKRLKEAEEMLQKTQSHNAEMEVQLSKTQEEMTTLRLQLQAMEAELQSVKKQQASAGDSSSLLDREEVDNLRQKIEELEAERQRLEEQNNILEMRLERHNLQGDYDPVRTRVLHFKMNPTTVAKQQRQQEVEALREEVTHLRELVRSLQDLGRSPEDPRLHISNLSLSLPPSKEVQELRKQMESCELKNQRLKEVFQRKIQEFRTVCYVLTGYQIDITTENQYRLTSVYAEHMEDSLLFKKSAAAPTWCCCWQCCC